MELSYKVLHAAADSYDYRSALLTQPLALLAIAEQIGNVAIALQNFVEMARELSNQQCCVFWCTQLSTV